MAIEARPAKSETNGDLQTRIERAQPGEVIQLPPGRIRGNFVIDKPLTLRGAGAQRTVLEGGGRGAILAVEAVDGEVHIEELGLSGGRSASGGAISIDNGARVFVVGCLFEKNVARSGRGGAVSIDRGALSLTECTLVGNRAHFGGAIFAGGDAKVEIVASIIAECYALKGGAIAAAEGAEVDILTSRLEVNEAEIEGHHLYAWGTPHQRPRILLSNALLGPTPSAGLAISDHGRFPASISLDNSVTGRELMAGWVVG